MWSGRCACAPASYLTRKASCTRTAEAATPKWCASIGARREAIARRNHASSGGTSCTGRSVVGTAWWRVVVQPPEAAAYSSPKRIASAHSAEEKRGTRLATTRARHGSTVTSHSAAQSAAGPSASLALDWGDEPTDEPIDETGEPIDEPPAPSSPAAYRASLAACLASSAWVGAASAPERHAAWASVQRPRLSSAMPSRSQASPCHFAPSTHPVQPPPRTPTRTSPAGCSGPCSSATASP